LKVGGSLEGWHPTSTVAADHDGLPSHKNKIK